MEDLARNACRGRGGTRSPTFYQPTPALPKGEGAKKTRPGRSKGANHVPPRPNHPPRGLVRASRGDVVTIVMRTANQNGRWGLCSADLESRTSCGLPRLRPHSQCRQLPSTRSPRTRPGRCGARTAQRTSVGLQGPSKNDLMWVAGYQTGEEVAIGKKAIYIAGSGLQAMNFDGTLRWTCPIGSTNQCCPAISQDEDGHEVIYLYGISYEDGVGKAGFFAVDENAPRYVDLYSPIPGYFFPKCLVNGFRWSCPTREIQSRAAIAADGSIFVTELAAGAPSGVLYKFAPDLTKAWQFPLPKGDTANGPAIGPDGTIYACARDNYLYAVTSAGTLKWKCKLANSGRSPVVGDPSVGGAVYVSDAGGTLSAINPATGSRSGGCRWGRSAALLPSTIRGRPSIAWVKTHFMRTVSTERASGKSPQWPTWPSRLSGATGPCTRAGVGRSARSLLVELSCGAATLAQTLRRSSTWKERFTCPSVVIEDSQPFGMMPRPNLPCISSNQSRIPWLSALAFDWLPPASTPW